MKKFTQTVIDIAIHDAMNNNIEFNQVATSYGTRLDKLSIHRVELTLEILQLLSHCTQLRELHLQSIKLNADDWLNVLASAVPHMRVLTIHTISCDKGTNHAMNLFDHQVTWSTFKLQNCVSYAWKIDNNNLLRKLSSVEDLYIDETIKFKFSEFMNNVPTQLMKIRIYLTAETTSTVEYRVIPKTVTSIHFTVDNTMGLQSMIIVVACCYYAWNARFAIQTKVSYKEYQFIKDIANYSSATYWFRGIDLKLIITDTVSNTFGRLPSDMHHILSTFNNIAQNISTSNSALWSCPGFYALVRELESKEVWHADTVHYRIKG